MLAGYELTTAEPKKEKLVNFKNTPVVEVCDILICAAFLCFLLYFIFCKMYLMCCYMSHLCR